MTNGSERLDRIERILEQVAKGQEQFQQQVAKSQEQFQEQVAKSHREMSARQQYHDEAFERHDAEMKSIREAIAVDSENIRALARIAELHNRRLEDLEGDEPA
jgi:cell fate regulator YaaT (PSP1 superfamily)